MKKFIVFITLMIALAVLISGCTDTIATPPLINVYSPNVAEVTLRQTMHTDEPSEPKEFDESSLPEEVYHPYDEILLAGGAVLILEEGGRWEWSIDIKFSILYEGEDEPQHLFTESRPLYEISPDKSKIAYILTGSVNSWHRGGSLYVFDVLENETSEPKYDGFVEHVSAAMQLTWLDNEILLLIVALVQGSATAGGSVHYYNITDGTNGGVIPHGEHFQIYELETDGDNLILTSALDIGGYSFVWDKTHKNSVPFLEIYEVIGNGGEIILDVPDIREIT